MEVTSGCDPEEVTGEPAMLRSGKERPGRGNSKHRLEQRERQRECAEVCGAQKRLGWVRRRCRAVCFPRTGAAVQGLQWGVETRRTRGGGVGKQWSG